MPPNSWESNCQRPSRRSDPKSNQNEAAQFRVKSSAMSLTVFFGLLGGIVVLAFVANRLAGWTRVPDVVVLMAAGMLLGPVFHLLDPSRFEAFARGFGALALILILFEAGLDLEFRNTLPHLPGGVRLALVSYGLSLVAIAAFLVAAIHLPRGDAFLVAAAFACVSSS